MRITEKYVFFWGGIYSQWYLRDMVIGGITFNCCEQWMMWSKAKLFGDTKSMELILNEKDPREQKKLGQAVSNFIQKIWEENKLEIVETGNYYKFVQNPDLYKAMFKDSNNGKREFVEASPKDAIWGIKMGENDKGVEDPRNWKGENLLGLSLSKVYHILENEKEFIS